MWSDTVPGLYSYFWYNQIRYQEKAKAKAAASEAKAAGDHGDTPGPKGDPAAEQGQAKPKAKAPVCVVWMYVDIRYICT